MLLKGRVGFQRKALTQDKGFGYKKRFGVSRTSIPQLGFGPGNTRMGRSTTIVGVAAALRGARAASVILTQAALSKHPGRRAREPAFQ